MTMASVHGRELVQFARGKLKEALGGAIVTPPRGEWTSEERATFVTLRWPNDELQGCIGSLRPRQNVVDDVAHNVVAAGLYDPRAAMLALEDVDELVIEVSLLGPLEPITYDRIQPGKDGIVFQWRHHRSTYLPVMWEHFSTKSEFMASLKEKAGLDPDFDAPDVKLFRYGVEKFS